MFTSYPVPPRQNNRSTGSKIPPEMIQHFKNTPQIPKRPFNSKENQNPRELLNVHPDISISKVESKGQQQISDHHDKAVSNQLLGGAKPAKSRIVQEDISKIASSYVLEGNLLKKQEAYEQAIKKQQKRKTVQTNKENSQGRQLNRKQILKLEYLQKMGFLRPDEKQVLAEFRKMHPEHYQKQTPAPRQTTHGQPLVPKEYQNEQMYNYYQFYSPKNMDPKKLTQFFSPNSKFAYHPNY